MFTDLTATGSTWATSNSVSARWNFCPGCGGKLSPDWAHCARCGKKLSMEYQDAVRPAEPSPEMIEAPGRIMVHPQKCAFDGLPPGSYSLTCTCPKCSARWC